MKLLTAAVIAGVPDTSRILLRNGQALSELPLEDQVVSGYIAVDATGFKEIKVSVDDSIRESFVAID